MGSETGKCSPQHSSKRAWFQIFDWAVSIRSQLGQPNPATTGAEERPFVARSVLWNRNWIVMAMHFFGGMSIAKKRETSFARGDLIFNEREKNCYHDVVLLCIFSINVITFRCKWNWKIQWMQPLSELSYFRCVFGPKYMHFIWFPPNVRCIHEYLFHRICQIVWFFSAVSVTI